MVAKKIRNAIEILERLTGDDPELREMIAEETMNAQVASLESDEDVATAWNLEIAQRVKEIRSGRASGTSADEVFAELRREKLFGKADGPRSSGLAEVE